MTNLTISNSVDAQPVLGAASSLVFSMALTHTLQGSGELVSFTRGDSDATIRDFEGRIRDCSSSDARFYGARRVQNLFNHSENFSHADWLELNVTKVGETVIDGVSCMEISMDASATAALYQLSVATRLNGRFAMRARVRSKSGTISLRLWPNGTATEASADISFGEEWTDIVHVTTGDLVNLNNSAIRNEAGGGAKSFYVAFIQMEEVSGQQNTNPSEYVSNGAGTEAESYTQADAASISAETDSVGNWTNDRGGVVSSQQAITNGTANALQVVADGITSVSGAYILMSHLNLVEGRQYAISIDFRGDGTNNFQCYLSNSTRLPQNINITGAKSHTNFIRYTETFTYDATDHNTLVLSEVNAGNTGTAYLDNISVKEIDHGSNQDGVKYFNHTNTQYDDPFLAAKHLDATGFTPGENVQPNGDMSQSDTSSGGAGNDGWQWTGTNYSISGGFLRHNSGAFAVVTTKDITLIAGVTYKVTYTLDGAAPLQFKVGNETTDIDGNALPLTNGTHTVYVNSAVNNSPLIAVIGPNSNGSTFTLSNVVVEGAWLIDDSTLKGVLIEQSSENLIAESEDFQTTWTNSNITFGQDEGPDGIYNSCDRLQATSNGQAWIDYALTLPTASTTYCISWYAKQGTEDWCAIDIINFTGGGGLAYFDLANGAVGNTTVSKAWITDEGNGWWRCTVQFAISTDVIGSFRIYLAQGNADVTMTAGDNIFLYGVQCEELPHPTSYMRTTGATVVRNAEELLYENPMVGDDIEDGMSITAETYALFDGSDLVHFPGSVTIIDTASPDPYLASVVSSSNGRNYAVTHDGSNIFQVNYGPDLVEGNRSSFGCSVLPDPTPGSAEMRQYKNGVAQTLHTGTYNNFTWPASQIMIGASTDKNEDLNWPVKNVSLYKKALPVALMEALTA